MLYFSVVTVMIVQSIQGLLILGMVWKGKYIYV